MSVINKMLQELDRRNAAAVSDSEQPPPQVKAVAAPPSRGHELFWAIVAALMVAAVGWVGWVAYQLQPRAAVATEAAFTAAKQARTGTISPASPPPATAMASAPPVAKSAVAAPAAPPAVAPVSPQPTASRAPEPQQVPPGALTNASPAPEAKTAPSPEGDKATAPARDITDTFKLAQAIETPIVERPASVTPPPAPAAAPSKPEQAAPVPRAKAAKPRAEAPKQRVEKRERSRAPNDNAEQQFRRAALYLNQGRVSEAEEQLVGALRSDPSHVAARQAYVALLLEQKRIDAAQRVLRDALAKDPTQPVFSLALARILAEQRDYLAALDVMDHAGTVAKNADFQALRGAVMQRLGRHQEAVDAYLAAIQGGVQPATTWVGLGISLEALGRNTEAAQAYRRSLAGALSRDVREYAETRMRALD